MTPHEQTRTSILYRSQTFTDGPLGPRTLLFFYPEGEWDGWRHREEVAEKAYPKSEYDWINMDEDFDPLLDASMELRHPKASATPILETEDA
jgi:hypothetical protein